MTRRRRRSLSQDIAWYGYVCPDYFFAEDFPPDRHCIASLVSRKRWRSPHVNYGRKERIVLRRYRRHVYFHLTSSISSSVPCSSVGPRRQRRQNHQRRASSGVTQDFSCLAPFVKLLQKRISPLSLRHILPSSFSIT
jgi:hypothetical protein